MDLRHKAEFKVELVEDTEDNTCYVYSEQLSTLEEIQERNSFEHLDVKREIEVKEDPLDIEEEVEEKEHFDIEEEEETPKYELSHHKISRLDQNESLIITSATEGEKGFEMKSTSRSRSQMRSEKVSQQSIKMNYLEKNLCCRYCNLSFNRKNELKTHLLKTHCSKMFKCEHCSYECDRKSNFERHLLIHNNIKLFKCSHCSYECKLKRNLKVHMLTHTNVKLFKCSDCSFKCNHKSNLKVHMRTHTNVKLFKCSDCSFECNQKSSLVRHMLTHANVKLFRCCDCSFKCNQRDVLKNHMLTHSNIKLFKCSSSDCSYECNRKTSLVKHMLTHENVKLFKCSRCSYASNDKGYFRIHMLAHENVKLFKCTKCSFGCNRKGSLKEHMLTHTGTPPEYVDLIVGGGVLQDRRGGGDLFIYTKMEEEGFPEPRMSWSEQTATGLTMEKEKKKNKTCQEIGRPGAGPTSLRKRGEGGRSSSEQSTLSLQPQTEVLENPLRVHNIETRPPQGALSGTPKANPSAPQKHHERRNYSYNLRGSERAEWSMEEKMEIYWCSTYARHEQFPKRGTWYWPLTQGLGTVDIKLPS